MAVPFTVSYVLRYLLIVGGLSITALVLNFLVNAYVLSVSFGIIMGWLLSTLPGSNLLKLLLKLPIGSLLAKPSSTSEPFRVNESVASITAPYLGKSYTVEMPVYRLSGRWNVTARFRMNPIGEDAELKMLVIHRMEETYIVGLPYCADHMQARSITIAITPAPDDGSTPQVQTFVGSEPIRLERLTMAVATRLQACD